MQAKKAWRAELSARRRAMSDDLRDIESTLLARTLSDADLGDVVCAYVPTRLEPGNVNMLYAMSERGIRVLLPVITEGHVLDWAPFTGTEQLVKGALNILEPTASRMGSAAIGTADTLLIPALAVDRRGVRLGKGGGFYDRCLPSARGQLVAVVGDDEVVDTLPAQPHDIDVHAILTPRAGLRSV